MSFQIPEPGTPQMVDLLCRLEQARYENAKEWIVVTIDDDSGLVCNATGPFPQAEQALVESGRMDADWKAEEAEASGTWTYVIVPLWGPGE